MEKYLGEFEVKIEETPYANYTQSDWAMEYMFRYSQIDGAHHKQWLLDQVARILKGTKVKVTLAKWSNGDKEHHEFRLNLDEPSQEYLDWVKQMRGEWINDKDYTGWEYSYDEGIAP